MTWPELKTLPLGTRVVVRYRIDGGFTDALGELAGRDPQAVSIRTKHGTAVVPWELITHAKPVPPAPGARVRGNRGH